MFNIILPKPCEIFAKFLLKICPKSGKGFTRFSTNIILAYSDRMIYFWENSNITNQVVNNVLIVPKLDCKNYSMDFTKV